jgi:Flp pilus assembly protein TadG
MKITRLISDQSGAVLVEATVMMILTLIFILGSVDFLLAYYQWTMANKAVQLGARIAAVSDPVAADLPAFDWTTTAYSPGDAVLPNSNLYSLICNGAAATCVCSATAGASAPTDCAGVGTTYSADAMRTIVYGRNYLNTGAANCAANATNNLYLRGMCQIFSRIDVANVVVTYKDTGLGYAYLPGGPTATVIITLQNLPFHFFFLSGLMGFIDVNISASATSMTGEDLSSTAPP